MNLLSTRKVMVTLQKSTSSGDADQVNLQTGFQGHFCSLTVFLLALCVQNYKFAELNSMDILLKQSAYFWLAKGLAYISIDKDAGDVMKLWPWSLCCNLQGNGSWWAKENCLLFVYLSISVSNISLLLTNVEAFDYPSTVRPPVSWSNHLPTDFNFWELAGERPILVNGSFVCGFHCKFEGTACLFAISIFPSSLDRHSSFSTQMVWSANRNKPIGLGAKLQFSREGDLTLQDDHDTLVWSTNTTGKFVSGMKLTHQGNLVLFDRNNDTIWQSFDHPTDCLVLGQRLVSGQKLKANMSATNWTEGLYSFSVDSFNGCFVASVGSDATLDYYQSSDSQRKKMSQFYAEFSDTNFGTFTFSQAGVSFIQLGFDGHLRSFRWVESEWKEVDDLFKDRLNRCDYPLACGEYGICSTDGRCSCPEPDENHTMHFKMINSDQPDLGCSPYVAVSCKSSSHESLLEIKNVSSSASYLRDNSNIIDIESCKQACLNNCSCKCRVQS
ncbi:hypothetical protein SLEP1_g33123 [Rubroshorea leprosula]|uniref:Bulb-type lectin domain-containing protein n=1 Tax=Rubroshorea leprosula TaxID=152421 RepID=A0AAV5KFL9_9ROSI|nr:hypothetical protein SLEP1_g33123 [Rubroshorea leprosula]